MVCLSYILRLLNRGHVLVNVRIQGAAKYMHEFHADRDYAMWDYAMCNIQSRSIPVAQLTKLRKLSNKKF
jgi:hypothetical protein